MGEKNKEKHLSMFSTDVGFKKHFQSLANKTHEYWICTGEVPVVLGPHKAEGGNLSI